MKSWKISNRYILSDLGILSSIVTFSNLGILSYPALVIASIDQFDLVLDTLSNRKKTTHAMHC